MFEYAGSIPTIALPVSNVSAPEILERPAPQPGLPLFGAPRPERPSAPANPDDPAAAAERGGAGLRGVRLPGRAVWAMWGWAAWARAWTVGTRGWRGVLAGSQRDSAGGAGWCGGGRCQTWEEGGSASAAGNAVPARPIRPTRHAQAHRCSLVVSSRRAAPGGQPLFESRWQKICYCGASNSL